MERTTWQVRQIFPLTKQDLMDLGDWEPFAVDPMGGIMIKRQTLVEGEKSSVGHELSFDDRHTRPYNQDSDPED